MQRHTLPSDSLRSSYTAIFAFRIPDVAVFTDGEQGIDKVDVIPGGEPDTLHGRVLETRVAEIGEDSHRTGTSASLK